MQTVSAVDNPVSRNTNKSSSVGESGNFEALLMMAQSTQIASVVESFSGCSKLSGECGTGAGSARRQRIDSEIAGARQTELDHRNTRGADPSSVYRGVVSGRHQRIVDCRNGGQNANEGMQLEATRASEGDSQERTSSVLDNDATQRSSGWNDTHSGRSNFTVPDSACKVQGDSKVAAPSQLPLESQQNTLAGAHAQAAVAPAAVSQPADVVSETTANTVGRLLASNTGAETARGVSRVQGVEATVSREGRSSNAKARLTARGSSGSSTKADTGQKTLDSRRTTFQRLVSQIRLNRGVQNSSATIRIDPPNLGKMKIDVRMEESTLAVRVEVKDRQTQRVISERLGELTESLRTHGIEVDRIEVHAREDVADSQNSDRGQQDAADGQYVSHDNTKSDDPTRTPLDDEKGASGDQALASESMSLGALDLRDEAEAIGLDVRA